MEPIAKHLLLPSSLIILSLLAGLILVFAQRAKSVARVLLAGAGLGYLLLGAGPLSFWLLGSLEYRYGALDVQSANDAQIIVVLSGYAERDDDVPLSSEVNSASAFRVLEAARIFRARETSTIVITGDQAVPMIMKDLLIAIGIPKEKIVTEDSSRNTRDSAMNIGGLVGKQRFFLVTSAGHMPRAMMVFEKQGLQPIPAPTDYRTRKNILATAYLPNQTHLALSDLAVHEYAAILWYWWLAKP